MEQRTDTQSRTKLPYTSLTRIWLLIPQNRGVRTRRCRQTLVVTHAFTAVQSRGMIIIIRTQIKMMGHARVQISSTHMEDFSTVTTVHSEQISHAQLVKV